MAEPDSNAERPAPEPPPDDGALHQKVLIAGVAVLFILIFVVIGVLVATRQ